MYSIEQRRIEIRQRLALNVTELRVRFGWTQGELAARAGVSQRLLRRVEDARPGNIRIDTLTAIANGLDVPLEVLLRPRTGRGH